MVPYDATPPHRLMGGVARQIAKIQVVRSAQKEMDVQGFSDLKHLKQVNFNQFQHV